MYKKLASAFMFGLVLASCGAPDEVSQPVDPSPASPPAQEEAIALRSMVEFLQAEPRFSTLLAALEAAEVLDQLDGEGPITLFAPTNTAFDDLPDALSVTNLLQPAYAEVLETVLLYHVSDEDIVGSQLEGTSLTSIAMRTGQSLPVNRSQSVVVLGQEPSTAVLVLPDIELSNGRVHVIDAVLIPPSE